MPEIQSLTLRTKDRTCTVLVLYCTWQTPFKSLFEVNLVLPTLRSIFAYTVLYCSFELEEEREMKMMNLSLEEDIASGEDALAPNSRNMRKSSPRRRLFRGSSDQQDDESDNKSPNGRFLGLKQRMRQRFSSPSPANRKKSSAQQQEDRQEQGNRKTSGMLRVLMNPITRRASSAHAPDRNIYKVDDSAGNTKSRKNGRKEMGMLSQLSSQQPQQLSPPLAVSSSSSSVDIRVVRDRVRAEMHLQQHGKKNTSFFRYLSKDPLSLIVLSLTC